MSITAAREIVEVGAFLSLRNLAPATSGNISRRIDGATIAVTRSGVDKGELVEQDVLVVDMASAIPGGASAETMLHLALYRDRPAVGAVIHTHSLAAALLSSVHETQGELILQGLELLKALEGVTTHEARVSLAVFPNDQDIPRLAARVSQELRRRPEAVAYLIAGHGLYSWGGSMPEARRHVVALEYLLTYELERRKLRP